MSATFHPELEQIFTELIEGVGPALDHARECPVCSTVLEEHRQLEKDLFRLADPLPPPELVTAVMAKVATTPQPVRLDVKAGLGIMISAVVLAAAAFVLGGGGLGQLGVSFANAAVFFRDSGLALAHGMSALWRTAAIPLTVGMTLVLLFSLYGLRRLTDLKLSEQKVLS